jgi:hypothetical protein
VPVSVSVALAIAAVMLLTCTDGVIKVDGRPALPMASLAVFAIGEITGLFLVIGAGWSIDWQPASVAGGHAITTGPDKGPPN